MWDHHTIRKETDSWIEDQSTESYHSAALYEQQKSWEAHKWVKNSSWEIKKQHSQILQRNEQAFYSCEENKMRAILHLHWRASLNSTLLNRQVWVKKIA